jgi:hypothetical protein
LLASLSSNPIVPTHPSQRPAFDALLANVADWKGLEPASLGPLLYHTACRIVRSRHPQCLRAYRVFVFERIWLAVKVCEREREAIAERERIALLNWEGDGSGLVDDQEEEEERRGKEDEGDGGSEAWSDVESGNEDFENEELVRCKCCGAEVLSGAEKRSWKLKGRIWFVNVAGVHWHAHTHTSSLGMPCEHVVRMPWRSDVGDEEMECRFGGKREAGRCCEALREGVERSRGLRRELGLAMPEEGQVMGDWVWVEREAEENLAR